MQEPLHEVATDEGHAVAAAAACAPGDTPVVALCRALASQGYEPRLTASLEPEADLCCVKVRASDS